MGWWRTDLQSESGSYNVIPGQAAPNGSYCGDEPADIIGMALDQVAAVYQATWGRPPSKNEIVHLLDFVASPYRETIHRPSRRQEKP